MSDLHLLPMLVPGCAFAETPKQTTQWLAVWSNKCFCGLRFGFCADTTYDAHRERGVDHGRLKDSLFARCVCSSRDAVQPGQAWM